MAAEKTVKARWVAGYEASLADGTLLIPGETVVEIPAAEAEGSDNWQPTKASAASKQETDS